MFKNFSEFTLIPDISSQDFIVGYTNDGVFSEEYRSTVSNVFGNFLSKNNVTIKNLEVLDALKAPSAVFSSLTATSAVITILDIRQYELSGFDVKGNVFIDGNLDVTNTISTSSHGTSEDWNSVYSNVNNASANWNSVYSNVNTNSATYATILFSNNKFLPLSGGEIDGNLNITNALAVGGVISGNDVVYSRELDFGSLERPSLTGIKQALNSFLYVSPALSYVRINGSSSQTLEVGQALTTPAITWTSNKVEPQAVSQYLLTRANGIVSTGNFTFSSFNDPNTYNITTIGGTATQQTSSWSVRVTDWNGEQATGTASANWRYRVYFGVTSSATPNSTDILNGVTSETNRPLATSRTGLGAKTVSPTNQYFYVAYPQRFEITSTIRVNGLNFTDFTQQSIATFTNASGGTDSYYVYRSNNLLTATYTIEII